jgi:hypothetical protein
MNRRDLLKGGFHTATGVSLLAAEQRKATPCNPCAPTPFPKTPSPRAKLKVKPVMTNMVHTGVWEGPCRFNVVTVEQERKSVGRTYQRWTQDLKDGRIDLGPDVEVMPPSLITIDESFTISAADFAGLEPDAREADVLLIAPHGSSNAAADLAARFQKPGILQQINCRTADVAAYARSQGEEILVANDGEELRRLSHLLRARKVFEETSVLFPTDRGFPSVASLTGITDLDELESRLGVTVKQLPYKPFAERVERTLADSAARDRAEAAAGELVAAARNTYVDREYVSRSLLFQAAVETVMDEHGCNAFTIECFEFCASRLPEKWKITPCLVHTLFKDRGIASSCEGDMGALLAMRMLMSLSGKSSHLGNMYLREGNLVEINHSAPGIRMNGFDEPGLDYSLGRFVESGWGTKVSVDFTQNTERHVTVARMHPNAKQLLIMKGELVRSGGHEKDNLGCSASAFVKPRESGDGERFVRRQLEYGNHLIWVYGDYSDEARELCELMNIEAEIIT